MESEPLNDILNQLEDMICNVRQINTLDLEPQAFYQATISRLHQIGETALTAASNLAIVGVQEGNITRKAAAEGLNVHPLTISRRIQQSTPPH